jgi:hypothetical protein
VLPKDIPLYVCLLFLDIMDFIYYSTLSGPINVTFTKKKKKKKKLGNEFLVFGFVEEPSLFMEETSQK